VTHVRTVACLLAVLASSAVLLDAQVMRRLRLHATTAAPEGGGDGPGLLARLDCDDGGAIGSGAGWPLCNSSSEVNAAENGTTYLKEESPSLGPQGQTAARWTFDARGATEEAFGWRWTGMPAVTAGHRMYIRYMQRHVTPWQTGDYGVKKVIAGDDEPTPDEQRIIITHRQWDVAPGSANGYTFNIDRNIDGLATGIVLDSATYGDDWITVQFEIDTRTPGASQGCLKTWLNTDVYASPTTSVCNEAFTGAYSGDMKFGYFGNMTEGGANVVYDECCFEYAVTSDTSGFDTTWTSGGTFWARSLRPEDLLRFALRRVVPWQGFSRAERIRGRA
jgi:hypothetical protein